MRKSTAARKAEIKIKQFKRTAASFAQLVIQNPPNPKLNRARYRNLPKQFKPNLAT